MENGNIESKDRQSVEYHRFLFHQGNDYRAYQFLGAHKTKNEGEFIFRVWAPRAAAVSLAGDFNGWDKDASPMKRQKDDPSVWELSAQVPEGSLYKFVITTDDGRVLYKADPYAFASEGGCNIYTNGVTRASRVWDSEKPFEWSDASWTDARSRRNQFAAAMNIYEVHAGSWKRKEDGSQYTYEELADILIPYVKDMGYTHIEFMPLTEFPYELSWGYQVTGYFSPTSRYGTPEGLKYLINKAHENEIGIILDWVPAHFPKDECGLVEFDGHPLYEDPNPFRMEHKGWGTRAFDFGRPEVKSFLISSAFFFCEKYHVDGLRVDAVAAMIYLDYDRKDGEWQQNSEGGRENMEATSFLKTMNHDILSAFPGVVTIAEESTAWPMVTKPPEDGGLGFSFKWNMGWMNDVLKYFSTDPIYRSYNHDELTFSIMYTYSENYVLPISHDEVVYGKCSMIGKMPGEYDDKFAQLRSFYVYMATHPGRKLTFMGQEFGQFNEWNEKTQLDWMLLDYERHRQLQGFVKKLNHFYKNSRALWKLDDNPRSFRWLEAGNYQDNSYLYVRVAGDELFVVALNLSGKDFPEYKIGVPDAEYYEIMIDTDAPEAGGLGRRSDRYTLTEEEWNGYPRHINVEMPPFSAVILKRHAKKGTVKKGRT